MPDIHHVRRQALRALLTENDLDALLISDLANVRYLTGFTGSHASLLVHVEGERGTLFGTDGRYTTQVESEAPDLPLIVDRDSVGALAREISRQPARYRRTGFESDQVTVDGHQRLNSLASGWEWIAAPGLTARLRVIKDETEIHALRQACRAADAALAQLLDQGVIGVGRTERDIARALDNAMLDHGSAERSFETIVGTGANAAIPHHRPGQTPVRSGDLLVMDFGAVVDGYHSDMTRTFAMGEPASWLREIYDVVARAQQSAVEAARAGAELRTVDAVARDIIDAAGHGENFSHGLGHNVGLHIHEPPILSQRSDGKLAAGMAITVEPGIYLPGRGGVRIEDTLIVRDGPPEVLTASGKEFTVVG